MTNTVNGRKALERVAGHIRAARARKQLTQGQVAEMAGVGPNKVSQIETGSVDPRLSTLDRVLKALDLAICIEDAA